MRFVNVYLVGYFLLVIGALAALWYGGVLQEISATWIVIGLVIAFGLGIMLAISRCREAVRKSSRFPRLAPAMSKIIPVAAKAPVALAAVETALAEKLQVAAE